MWLQYLNLPKVGVQHCDMVTNTTMVYHVVWSVIHAEAAGPHLLWRNWAVAEYQAWLHDQHSANLLALLSCGFKVHVQEQPLQNGGEVASGMQRISLSYRIGNAVGTVPGRASKALVATTLQIPIYPPLMSQDAPCTPQESFQFKTEAATCQCLNDARGKPTHMEFSDVSNLQRDSRAHSRPAELDCLPS